MSGTIALRIAVVVGAAAALAGARLPARAQQAPGKDSQSYLYVLEPQAWTGEGSRDLTGTTLVKRPTGSTLTISGRVYDPSGITQITINGHPAVLEADQNHALHFSAVIPINPDSVDQVEITATPASGAPLVRRYAWRMFTAPSGPPPAVLGAPSAVVGASPAAHDSAASATAAAGTQATSLPRQQRPRPLRHRRTAPPPQTPRP